MAKRTQGTRGAEAAKRAPKESAKAVLKAAGDADRVELARLVNAGADPNAFWRGYRLLHALIQEKAHGEAERPTEARMKCLDWLLQNGANPELLGAWPPARALLDAGADPKALTKSWSHEVDAAYFACSSGHAEMLTLLLERGADATAALSSAAWQPSTALAEICLAHGAVIDRAAHDGKPLLNQLVRWGQVKPALWLLERGASPNVADERGWTALHQAASRGNERMLRACLDAGADRAAKDHAGFTPVAVALVMRRVKMVEMLAQ